MRPLPLEDFEAELDRNWIRGNTRTTNRGELTTFEPSTAGGVRLVVKRCPGWTGAQVVRLVSTVSICREYAQSCGLAPFVAAVRAWGHDPDYVCSEWVEGVSVDDWMAEECEGLPSSQAVARSLEIAAGMAELMAHFHEAMADEVTAAGDDAGALVGRRALADSVRVYSIEDPGPHNTVLGRDGTLWLIDLPADARVVPVERDIARLVSRIVGAVHRHADAVWVPYRPIADAVDLGYRRAGPPGVRIDRSLVYAALASDAAVKAVFTRRRLPPGTRLECLIRESAAAVTLGARALGSRLRR
jgi:hypothetical protein